MTKAFWFWLFMAAWVIWGARMDYANRAAYGWWWWSRGLLAFLLFLIIGLELFRDPLGTLVK